MTLADQNIERDARELKEWAEAHVLVGSLLAAQILRVLEDREKLKEDIRELRTKLVYLGVTERVS